MAFGYDPQAIQDAIKAKLGTSSLTSYLNDWYTKNKELGGAGTGDNPEEALAKYVLGGIRDASGRSLLQNMTSRQLSNFAQGLGNVENLAALDVARGITPGDQPAGQQTDIRTSADAANRLANFIQTGSWLNPPGGGVGTRDPNALYGDLNSIISGAPNWNWEALGSAGINDPMLTKALSFLGNSTFGGTAFGNAFQNAYQNALDPSGGASQSFWERLKATQGANNWWPGGFSANPGGWGGGAAAGFTGGWGTPAHGFGVPTR